MPGYVLMHADVTGPGGYEEFKSLAAAAIADHGGRYLVRGRAMQPLEGEWWSRVVLVEFPTYAAALAMIPTPTRRLVRSACAHRPQVWSSWTASPMPDRSTWSSMTSAQDRAPRAGSGMAGQTSTRPEEPIREGKYSRIERGDASCCSIAGTIYDHVCETAYSRTRKNPGVMTTAYVF